MSRYLVMTSSASNRGGYGPYRNVAVVEADNTTTPKFIGIRAKGTIRIVRWWPAQYVGTTNACEYQRALAEAHALAQQLTDLTKR